MTRVLKISTLLFGLILLTLALGGTRVRSTDPPELGPLFVEQDLRGNDFRFFQVWPGIEHPFFLTPPSPDVYLYWGIDAAQQAAYVMTNDVNTQRMHVYQLRGRHPRLIVENAYVGTVYAASDFSWMLYALDDPDGGWEYWAIHLPTGKRLSITDLVQPRPIAFREVHRFSDDGEWLYLVVQELDPPRYEIVAVHLSDGAVMDMTNGKGGAVGVHMQGVVNDWVIFDRGGEMYRIHPDGSDFGSLSEPQINVGEDAITFSAFVSQTYPAYDLALIHQSSRTIAVDVEAGTIHWEYDRLGIGYAPDNPTGWIIGVQDGVTIRLHLPTGETQPLPDMLAGPVTYLDLASPDGTWALYTQRNPASGHFEWWHYTWATGQSRRIHPNVDTLDARGISPDGQWIWAMDQQSSTLIRMRVSDGQTEVMLSQPLYNPTLYGWMKPPVHTWHPTPLILISLILIVIGMMPRRLLQLRHRKPPLGETT